MKAIPLNNTSRYCGSRKRATDADRLWFEQHPERKYRLRYWIAGEYDGEPNLDAENIHCAVCVLVAQLAPGVRVRVAVWLPDDLRLEAFPEDICSQMWVQAMREHSEAATWG